MKHKYFWAYVRQTLIHLIMTIAGLFGIGALIGAFVYKSVRGGVVAALAFALVAAICYNLDRHPAFQTQKQVDNYYYYVQFLKSRKPIMRKVVTGLCYAIIGILWYCPTYEVRDNYPHATTNMVEEFQISPVVMSILSGMPGSTTQLYYAAAEAADSETDEELERIAGIVNTYQRITPFLIILLFIGSFFLSLQTRYETYLTVSKKLEEALCKK